jgi:hypothetical protein
MAFGLLERHLTLQEILVTKGFQSLLASHYRAMAQRNSDDQKLSQAAS